MLFACPACNSRHDVSGYSAGQLVQCRCGVATAFFPPSPQAGALDCPRCGAAVAATSTMCGHCATPLLVKACPRCFSRVFHGHKHCSDCGAELTLSTVDEPAAARPCPRCQAMLAPRRIADVVLDECATCGGVFLDRVAIERVIADRQQSRAEALLGALPKAPLPPPPAPGRMYVKCPVCQAVMNRRQFAASSGIVVDVCRAHGTYFDAGELPRAVELVQNGGIERAERKQLEALRASVRRESDNARYAAMMAARSSTHAFKQATSSSSLGAGLVDLLRYLLR